MVHTTEESNRLYNRSRLVQELAKGRHHSSVDQSMLKQSVATGLDSQAKHLCSFNLFWNCDEKRTKIKKKRSGFANLKNKL